ncbi:MAG: glycosyl transferase, partial [Syntrophales bacterium]
MADFWQHGMVTTLQKLRDYPVEELENELTAISRGRKIVLLLPALFSEFETPAVPRIIEELKDVGYLHRIVLSLDRATEKDFKKAKELMSRLQTDVRVVWHDGPVMQTFYDELRRSGFNLDNPGKGQSVWMTMGYILSERDVYA